MGWIWLAMALLVLMGIARSRPPVDSSAFIRTLPADRPLITAHRGGAGLFPENTLNAFRGALDMGAHILEMDIRLTSDGVPVVLHDEAVDRTTDGRGPVGQFTLAELQALDAGYPFQPPGVTGDHPFRGQGIRIPTLREVFEAFPQAHMVVEVKENSPVLLEAVAALVVEFDRTDRTLLASFERDVLGWFRDRLPAVATHASEREVFAFVVLSWLGLEGLIRPEYEALLVPMRSGPVVVASRRFARAARRRNLFVSVWTIEDRETMQWLLHRGVEGITTGRPDVALDLTGL